MQSRRILIVAPPHIPAEPASLAVDVAGADVLVVVPAGPVPGERWIADRTARDRQARRRIAEWTAALAPHARRVAGEVGDPSRRLAEADARAAFAPHAVIVRGPGEPVRRTRALRLQPAYAL